jgi:hypothetical protein
LQRNATALVLTDINAERSRQVGKWGEQHHPDGTGSLTYAAIAEGYKFKNDNAADGIMGVTNWADIMLEEVYEALAETDPEKLRAELIQACAVGAAWVEDIDSRKD